MAVPHTLSGVVSSWFMPPLSGTLEVLREVKGQWPHLVFDVFNIPNCIQRTYPEPIDGLRFRYQRRYNCLEACGGQTPDQNCCGFAPEYPQSYSNAEVSGGQIVHDPIDLDELDVLCKTESQNQHDRTTTETKVALCTIASAAESLSSPEIIQLAELLQTSVGRDLKGFTITEIALDPIDRVFLTLRRGESKLELIFGLPDRMLDYYAKVGRYVLCHRRETPLDSVRKQEALEKLVELIDGQNW